jgi:hypothetical protein
VRLFGLIEYAYLLYLVFACFLSDYFVEIKTMELGG